MEKLKEKDEATAKKKIVNNNNITTTNNNNNGSDAREKIPPLSYVPMDKRELKEISRICRVL